MPLTVHVVSRDEVYSKVRELRERGYTCRADDDGDWECTKPINELLVDIRYIVVKPS